MRMLVGYDFFPQALSQIDMSPRINVSAHSREAEIVKTVGDDFPVAIAIWQTDHSLLFINNHAAQLTGFANADLSEATALWGERVHVDDRATFSSSWGELRKGTRQSTCDYRFFPKHSKTAIRLMEVSVLTPGLQLVVSVYFRTADLCEEPKHKETERVLRTLLHDIQNYLHVVKMEIELAELGLQSTLEVAQLAKTLSLVAQVPRDLRDYLGANAMSMTLKDLESVLKNIVRRMQYQLYRQKANLRLVRRGPLPPVEVDKNQACGALEHVLESCGVRLKKGGGIKIDAGQIIDVRGQPDAELKVTTMSAESIGIDVSDSLRSSVRVGENQVEIALDLAHEILRRYHGQVTFRRKTRGKASENLDEGFIQLMDGHSHYNGDRQSLRPSK
jgi:hypothetical protein